MFDRLIEDVTNAILEKLAARTHADNVFNKRDADRRALMFLSTDRTGYNNTMRNVDNAVLGCNNDRQASRLALDYLKEQLKPANGVKDFKYVDSLIRSLA